MLTIPNMLVVAGAVILLSLTLPVDSASAATGPAANPVQNKMDSTTTEQRMARRKAMQEHWETMSTEERQQLRVRMEEHWKGLTPEQRNAKRTAMREHFENMSPAERQQFKRDMGIPGVEQPDGDDDQDDTRSEPTR